MGKARAKRWQLEREKQRKLLWLAFAVTELMFFVQICVGFMASSASLQLSALETSDQKAITDTILKQKLSQRQDAIFMCAGATLALAFCLWTIGLAFWNRFHGIIPDPWLMAAVSGTALSANLFSLVLLRRHLSGSPGLKAAWRSAQNGALGDAAVLAAAVGIYTTGDNWPDAAVVLAIFPFAFYQAGLELRRAYATLRKK